MKRTWIIVLVILGIIFLGGCSSYNGLVDKQVEVDKEWGNVQTQYQRRADVLINLMETVKGAAANENSDAMITWSKHVVAFLPPGGDIFATIAGCLRSRVRARRAMRPSRNTAARSGATEPVFQWGPRWRDGPLRVPGGTLHSAA